jgi:CRISPR-associated protein Cas2
MLVIVTYDVSTLTLEGRRRLRRVSKICVKWGQRVQNSVFECQVNPIQYEELEHALVDIINPKEDSLRVYRLTEPARLHIREFGNVKAIDFENDPLIL